MDACRPTGTTGEPVTLLPPVVGAILVCAPNLALGVLLLIFRRPVSSVLTKVFRRLRYAHPAVPMTLVIVSGVFLIVIAGGGLTSAVVSVLSN
jgi:hypothetical protein